jgi:hypothetical protein
LVSLPLHLFLSLFLPLLLDSTCHHAQQHGIKQNQSQIKDKQWIFMFSMNINKHEFVLGDLKLLTEFIWPSFRFHRYSLVTLKGA